MGSSDEVILLFDVKGMNDFPRGNMKVSIILRPLGHMPKKAGRVGLDGSLVSLPSVSIMCQVRGRPLHNYHCIKELPLLLSKF